MEGYVIIIVGIVVAIIMKLSIHTMIKIIRGDLYFPTLPKISLPKRKKEEKKKIEIPDKQKDFIQLN